MTNADRIRKMTDEELFKFIVMIESNELHYNELPCEYCWTTNTKDCYKCIRKWLKNDVKN